MTNTAELTGEIEKKVRWKTLWIRWMCVACLLLMVLLPELAHSRNVLNLDSSKQPVALLDWGDYWIDTSGKSSPQQTQALPPQFWQPTQPDTVFQLKAEQKLWIRFTVPPAPDRERWFLALPNASINQVDLYTLDLAGQWVMQSAGDMIPAHEWPLPYRYPLLPIALTAEMPTHYLLRISHSETFTAPVYFANESNVSFQGQSSAFLLGLFFGLLAFSVLVSIVSAVSLRDWAFGFFALSLLLMGLSHAGSTGIGHLYLWPTWLRWNDIAFYVLKLLAVSSVLIFSAVALSVRQRSVWVYRLVVVLAGCGAAAALAMFWLYPLQRFWFFTPVFLLLQIGGLLIGAWSWRRGDSFAPWLLLSYLPLLIAVNLGLTTRFVPLTDNIATQFSIAMGVTLHIPIALVLLAVRCKRRWENMRRMNGLDRIDPSTGLINRNVFEARLLRMIARSDRLRYQSMVLLIDIVNTEQIQRDFGHKAAQEMPLRLAHRLQSTIREIDSAARLSDQRFGMLIEGPCTAEEAAQVGPQMVARCLMPYSGLHLECVAQVRVAYAVVPEQGSNAQGVLSQLEARLDKVPANSKKAVFGLALQKA